MKKENVYVVVDTEKKAKKVKDVLDMFGEPIFELTDKRLSLGMVDYEYITVNFNMGEWTGNTDNPIDDKSKVSIKQLRNILALEHLKQGDVVVVKGGISDAEYVVKVSELDINNHELKLYFHGSEYYNDGIKGTQSGVYGNFVRYANKEEKDLFEPKQMEVGKWYASEFGGVVNYQGDGSGYGMSSGGYWCDNSYWYFPFFKKEATPEQVEEALVKEAKIRGLVCGEVLVFNGERTGVFGTESYIFHDGCLFLNCFCIFKNGKWAEVVEKQQIKKGSRVVVVDNGQTFSTHNKRKEYGVTDELTPALQNGTKATVYNLVTVNRIKESACIISDCGKQSLIGLKGLELC